MIKQLFRDYEKRSFGLALLLLVTALGSQAATHTVCATGCTFNNSNSAGNPVQAAINAAVPGDIIELAAGEIFPAALYLPNKKGSRYITIRSSRWRDLPLPGYRVNPEQHASLMAVLQQSQADAPALRAGTYQRQVSAVDQISDNLTIPGHQWATNTPISCRSESTIYTSYLPANLQEGAVYYVINTGANTFQLSQTINGPAVDITGTLDPRTWCVQVDPSHHYRFIGIDIQTKPGVEALYNLVEIGSGDESSVAAVPHHIEFERCFIRGFPNDPGPRNLVVLNGANTRVEDSWLAHAKQYASESHAIVMTNTPGPAVIRNNYLNAASLNILTGGSGTSLRGMSTTDLVIEGNLIEKLPYQLYGSGNGAPSGACLSGRYYRNVAVTSTSCADGGCYTCQDGAWVQDLEAPYRSSHYLTKALIEFKHCLRCRVERNLIRTGFDGHDTGNPGYCALFSVIGDTRAVNKEVVFRNNHCADVWSGIGMGVNDPPTQVTRSGPIRVENNLITGMGQWPQYSLFNPEGAGAQRRATFFTTGYDNLVMRNNTIRAGGNTTFGILFSGFSGGPIPGFVFENNILPQGIFVDGAEDTGCGPTGIGKFIANAPGRMKNSILYGSATSLYWSCSFQNLALPPSVAFVSGTDNRLSPGSPHSASCTSGCAFAGTDGKDLGADIPIVEEAVSGRLAGTPTWSEQAQLRISPGSTRALVSYFAPDDVSCTVELFENAAMTQLYTDTINSGAQADTRSGSVFDGRRRRFVLGTQMPLVASTLYYGRLRCGDRTMPFQLRTKTPGSEIARFGLQLQDSQAHNVVVEFDSDPSMPAPQVTEAVAFSNGVAKVSFPVAPGTVVYARWKKRDQSNTALASGPVEVYVAP